MRNAASCPFQIFDCHMAKYSPAITMKPKNQRPKPTVNPATAQTFERLKTSAGALRRLSNTSVPTTSNKAVDPPKAAIHAYAKPQLLSVDVAPCLNPVPWTVVAKLSPCP